MPLVCSRRLKGQPLAHGDRVIAGSQYAVEGSKCVGSGILPEVRAFAEVRQDWLVELNASPALGGTGDQEGVVAVAGELANKAALGA